MWTEVVHDAVADTCATTTAAVLRRVDALEVVYCQTAQYDDAPTRLAQALAIDPKRKYYSGIGGTTPQQLVNATAERILNGELDIAIVVSGEALATQKHLKKQGIRAQYAHSPSEKRPFPWEAPFHPAEVAHEVFQAWLTFAMFDNARRAHRNESLDLYRDAIAMMMAPMTTIAAHNPRAWFRSERSAAEIAMPSANNRLVGYPYTKYMTSVMDVDMAAAVIVASDEVANELNVPLERRVYLHGWSYATDAVYVAERDSLSSSPAMRAAFNSVLQQAQLRPDEIEFRDLYSCFPSSLNFALDALESLSASDSLVSLNTLDGSGAMDSTGTTPGAREPLTVTGGLPYHGGPASGYMTHSIAAMVQQLREQPDAYGLVTGVGMHMTKHVATIYSARQPSWQAISDPTAMQSAIDVAHPKRTIVNEHDGPATIATYCVVHGADGGPSHAVLVGDIDATTRCYAFTDNPEFLVRAESEEVIGSVIELSCQTAETTAGSQPRNILRAH